MGKRFCTELCSEHINSQKTYFSVLFCFENLSNVAQFHLKIFHEDGRLSQMRVWNFFTRLVLVQKTNFVKSCLLIPN